MSVGGIEIGRRRKSTVRLGTDLGESADRIGRIPVDELVFLCGEIS
jgi:hypothetical protein